MTARKRVKMSGPHDKGIGPGGWNLTLTGHIEGNRNRGNCE